MARSGAVWAIDIGQCALKALRCHADSEADRIAADAFDYIEYPKILSQPGADPAELIDEALKRFLSRNSVKGDRVAISVSGQSGLARFIKLPPVEAKKIPDIVRYEARQQIPFDLNDVIWDYQRMGGGSVEEGFALETEVGLFAMKRDAVFRALEPYRKAGIEVDFVQLAPLALYNYLLFDRLTDLPPAEEYDPEDPPESVVVLSLGTDATDLVVTNGFRVWQRSVPIGGSHFTKALTKELKLTFAKAEHLKRNAATAPDSKALFQAMRPVFRDLLTELQRSIGYFNNLDRAAKIGQVVALGNTMKLPGLRKYLSQSLGYEVQRLDAFRGLGGSQVVGAPAFKDNVLCFAACYGLALQGLGKAGLRTNLLPKEILKERLVLRKKPWALAASAAMLLACGISFGAYAHGLSSLAPGKAVNGVEWQNAERQATGVQGESTGLLSEKEARLAEFATIDDIGRNLTGNVEGRLRWLELLRAIDACMPPYTGDAAPSAEAEATDDEAGLKSPVELAQEITERERLYVTGLQCQHFSDLSTWYATLTAPGMEDAVWFKESPSAGAERPTEGDPNAVVDPAAETPAGPSGPGWVVRLTGHHFHNFARDAQRSQAATFVLQTLLTRLGTGTVTLPNADRTGDEEVSMKELGIGFPVLISPGKVQSHAEPNPFSTSPAEPMVGAMADDLPPINLLRFDFDVQFCWQPKTPSEREEARRELANQEQDPNAY